MLWKLYDGQRNHQNPEQKFLRTVTKFDADICVRCRCARAMSGLFGVSHLPPYLRVAHGLR